MVEGHQRRGYDQDRSYGGLMGAGTPQLRHTRRHPHRTPEPPKRYPTFDLSAMGCTRPRVSWSQGPPEDHWQPRRRRCLTYGETHACYVNAGKKTPTGWGAI